MRKMDTVSDAAASLKKGNVVIVYDGDEREGEADMLVHARYATPEIIEIFRKCGGGLICVALEGKIAEELKLPFYTEILAETDFIISKMECKKTAYHDTPSFSISVNHRNVYTGITDRDRSLTIRNLSKIAEKGKEKQKLFLSEFYSPGHVFLLIGRGINNRKGHTELSLELAKKADLSGVMVLCEMLGKGAALSKKDAKEYAKRNGLIFLEGKDIWR